MMRAAVLTGNRGVKMDRVEAPQPKAGELRINVEGCGVCASSLPVWEGREWFTYPTAPGAPGHEGWGVVDAIGDHESRFKVGQRVSFLSGNAFAEFDLAREEGVVPIPAELDGKPVPGEAIGCAMNIFRRSDIEPGQTVAIVGIGWLGALLVQLAKNRGAKVIAISRRDSALEFARAFGADETIPMLDHYKIIEQVKEITRQQGCERVIEAVGQQWPLDLAAELTAERAKLIIAGYHQDGARQVNMQLWNWRGLDVVNAHERDPRVYAEGIAAGLDAMVRGELDPSPLYSTYALDQLDRAMTDTVDRPGRFVKAVVTV